MLWAQREERNVLMLNSTTKKTEKHFGNDNKAVQQLTQAVFIAGLFVLQVFLVKCPL